MYNQNVFKVYFWKLVVVWVIICLWFKFCDLESIWMKDMIWSQRESKRYNYWWWSPQPAPYASARVPLVTPSITIYLISKISSLFANLNRILMNVVDDFGWVFVYLQKKIWVFRRHFSASGAVFNQRLQASHITMLVRDILFQLFNERYQIVHFRQQILCVNRKILVVNNLIFLPLISHHRNLHGWPKYRLAEKGCWFDSGYFGCCCDAHDALACDSPLDLRKENHVISCAITVNQTRVKGATWAKDMAFNDESETWNKGNQTKVVLIHVQLASACRKHVIPRDLPL